MGKTTGGSQTTDETRLRLLAAAQEVVAREGWSGATSRKIVDEAGVNLALINYHFGSKRDLLYAALDEATVELEAVSGSGAPSSHALVEGLAELDGIGSNRAGRVVLAAVVEATKSAALASVVRHHLKRFRATTALLIGPGSHESGYATLIAAAFDGLLLHRLIDPETDVSAAAQALADILKSRSRERAPSDA